MAVLSLRCVLAACLVIAVTARCLESQACAGKGTLADRISKNQRTNDANDDSMVTAREMFSDLAWYYDKDDDSCVSKKEWMHRWDNYYGFSPEFAAAMYPGDESCCGLDILEFAQDPANAQMPTAGVGSFLLQTLATTCNNDISLYDTNCDCMQLKLTCQEDTKFKSYPACVSFLACEGRGTLSERFVKNLRANDQNGNGVVSGDEFTADSVDNYDTDKNGCIEPSEWMDRWTKYFKFSEEYARGRFSELSGGMGNATCAVDISLFARFTMGVEEFLESNVQTLINVCQGDKSLMTSICDCIQLEDMCQNDAQFKDLSACQNFTSSKEN